MIVFTQRDVNGSPISLVLYVDDTLVGKNKNVFDACKDQLILELATNVLGLVELILDMQTNMDRQRWLHYVFQEKYIERVLERLNMNDAKVFSSHLLLHVKLIETDCPKDDTMAK